MKKMKVVFGGILLMLLAGEVNAQTEEGRWLAGGNAGFTSANSTSTLYLNPNLGHFFVNQVAAGLSFSYYNSSSSLLSVGPFARGYLKLGDAAALFAQTRITYTNVSGAGIANGDVFGGGIGPAFAVFLKENIALETMLEYYIPDFSNSGNSLSLNIGFQIHL